MVININLASNNHVYYHDIEKTKSAEGYIACVYRSNFTKRENIFPILKDMITARKEVDAEFFITKLNKLFRREIVHTKSFGQAAKQIVLLMNSYVNTISSISLRQPLALSITYLNGKPLPKIEKICLIDNNMYFVTKYKKGYIMHVVNNENMKCIIPLSNVFSLYKRLKKINYVEKNTKKKPNSKRNSFSHEFQVQDIIIPAPTTTGRRRFARNPLVEPVRESMREPRRPETNNMYEAVPLEQNDNDEETIDTPWRSRLLERNTWLPEQNRSVEQGVPEPLRSEPDGPPGPELTEICTSSSCNHNFYYTIQESTNDEEIVEEIIEVPQNRPQSAERYELSNDERHAERNANLQVEEAALSDVESTEREALLLDENVAVLRTENLNLRASELFVYEDITPDDSDSD